MRMHPSLQTMKTIAWIAVTLCLLLLPLRYPPETFLNRASASVIPMERAGLLWWEPEEDMGGDEMPGNWKDIRKARLRRQITGGEVRALFLCSGDTPFTHTTRKNKENPDREMIQDKASIWVRDADDCISQAAFNPATDKFSADIQEDLELSGLYLVGRRSS